jgi:hypothetical protein
MGYCTHPANSLGGPDRDTDDHARLRHARDRQSGFPVGRYLQPPPMLFTRDGHNVFLGDMYRGTAAFLLCSGPSLKSHDLSQLQQRGILTCAVNNAATVVRPQLWVSVDDPNHFADAIWRDPAILKFVPLCHLEKPLAVRDANDQLVPSPELAGDMPAVFGYRRNEAFVAEQFLYEDTFNWGNHGERADAYGYKGSRSVMLVALRLLFYLGVRKLFLLGCDFRMQYGADNYAFAQDRSRGSVSGNNYTFEVLNTRLQHLLPHFEREGYQIFNCAPDSGLTVFPHMPYATAIEQALEGTPRKIVTAGMYDQKRKKKDREAGFAPTSDTRETATVDALRSEESQLPPTTLVTYVDEKSRTYLSQTWATWQRFRPWLRALPAVVLHPASLDCQSLQDELAALRPDVQFVAANSDSDLHDDTDWSHAVLRYAARSIQTPWYLQLAPEAIALRDDRWLDPSWFSNGGAQPPLAFVTCPWGYSKPADILDRLDQWGSTVAELAGLPPLQIPYDPTADRVKHASTNTWLFLGSTEWSRTIARYAPDGLPCASFSTFVAYCAQRRRDRFILHQMKHHGWDHSFRGQDRIAERCRRLLGC